MGNMNDHIYRFRLVIEDRVPPTGAVVSNGEFYLTNEDGYICNCTKSELRANHYVMCDCTHEMEILSENIFRMKE